MFKSFLVQLKREYWEYNALMLKLPLGFGIGMICALLVGVFYFSLTPNKQIYVEHNGFLRIQIPDRHLAPPQFLLDTSQPEARADFAPQQFEFSQRTIEKVPLTLDMFSTPQRQVEALGPLLMLVAGVIALVCLILLTSSVSSDRKDKSILVWRSLPIPESRSVLAKYTTALLVTPAIYLTILSISLSIMLGITMLTESIFSPANTLIFSNVFITAYAHFWQGLPAILLSLLWAAPIVAWFGLVSAYPHRYAPLLGIVSIVSISAVEWLVFRSDRIFTGFKQYFEQGSVETLKLIFGQKYYIDPQYPITGAVLAVLFIVGTIYVRKWRID
jgi:ABC-2 type transport system permease protein